MSKFHYQEYKLDPLTSIISLLHPRTILSKVVEGSGSWGVRYPPVETAGFGLVLAGECHLALEGGSQSHLKTGDFVLLPSSPGFTMSSSPDVEPRLINPETGKESTTRLRHGKPEGDPDFQLLGGYFCFEPANLTLLLKLLPDMVHIQALEAPAHRLTSLIELITEEVSSQRPGRHLVLERLVEVMLIEAVRFSNETSSEPRTGLLSGLADQELAEALRALHEDVSRAWTVEGMATIAGLSRSSFSERFKRVVGSSPMEYLKQWRMALAKDMLLNERRSLEEIAYSIGYQSASAFSTAFRDYVGLPPSHFARGAS